MKLLIFVCFAAITSCQLFAGKTIAIFTYEDSRVRPWDADSIHHGITGSEEAIIYLSQKLAELGHQVTIFAHPPKDSKHSSPTANPRYLPLHFNDGTVFDVALSWRFPWNGKELKTKAHQVYFWPHDTCCFQLSEEQIHAFDEVLWLSQWQRTQWLSFNPSMKKFTTLFGNGINPNQFNPHKKHFNPFSCIYSSNYARGLEILLDIWPRVKQQFPQTTLQIYYGWQHWGLLTKEKEEKMKKQIEQLSALDVKECGQVGHEALNRAFEESSFWLYPCIGPETFCITALRAQFAGALPVVIKGSALHETVRYGTSCHSAEDYFETLVTAFQQADQISLEDRKKMKEFILQEYTWDILASKLEKLIASFEKNKVP